MTQVQTFSFVKMLFATIGARIDTSTHLHIYTEARHSPSDYSFAALCVSCVVGGGAREAHIHDERAELLDIGGQCMVYIPERLYSIPLDILRHVGPGDATFPPPSRQCRWLNAHLEGAVIWV